MNMSAPPVSRHCLDILRRCDFDHYIASLFAPAPKRAGLVAIWAFECEMARLVARLKQPLMGEIRLRWWCDEIEKFGTSSRNNQHEAQNPLLFALEQAVIQFNLPKQSVITACEAHMRLSYISASYAPDLCEAEDEAIFFQLACQILLPEQASLAHTTCLHAGRLKALSRSQEPESALCQDSYQAFITEVAKLPRPLRPAFASLATLSARLKTKNSATPSPLRRLWLIACASLGGYFSKSL